MLYFVHAMLACNKIKQKYLLAESIALRSLGLDLLRFLCHLSDALECCADIEIQANEILHHKLTLNGYLAEFTGQSMERITQVLTYIAATSKKI